MTIDIEKTFFTSDPHYGHDNIIRYCNRPFTTAEEMDRVLIENWNSVVPSDGLVYLLGDGTMKYSKKRMAEILNKLNGTKVLIKGNHDNKGNIATECFVAIADRLHITGEGYDFILVHDPAEASANHMDAQQYLCGHLHSIPERRVYYNWIDVGVDGNNFTPIPLKEILKIRENEAKKGLSADELLLASTSSYNQYAQRRRDPSRTPSNVPKLL